MSDILYDLVFSAYEKVENCNNLIRFPEEIRKRHRTYKDKFFLNADRFMRLPRKRDTVYRRRTFK